MYFPLFPVVLGTYTPEVKTRVVKPKRIVKYDHQQMINDKISGMSWREIGIKHGVVSGDKDIAKVAHRHVMYSSALKNLKPEKLELLEKS